MKKYSFLLIALLVLSLVAVPVLAAQSATMSVSVSKSSVYRGETFTVTVSTSAVENCTSGGFLFSYDKNAFEYVGGSALMGGFTAGVSTAAGNVAGYFMNGNASVQGGLFRITLKVKDSAAFGNYTITGRPNLTATDGAVTCSAGSTTITVACQHNYGGWSNLDGDNHGKTCSICQNVQKEGHKWDNGTVIKEATCKEEGTMTYSCSVCNATRTEVIAKTNDHKFGNWTNAGADQHKHVCSVCSKEEAANHNWDGGKISKEPTCKEEGIMTYTCADCNATKTEAIAKTNDHSFGSWTSVDGSQHKHICSVCAKEETAEHKWNSGVETKKPTCKEEGEMLYTCTVCNGTKTEAIAKLTTHTYDHDCDADCNVCGLTRTITHQYKTSWSKDKSNHWHECSICKDKKDVSAHTPGAAATETKAQTCTTCGYVIKAALGHKHAYAEAWTTDENGHWHACSGCDEKDSYADHAFDNACDTDCSVCGYTREVKHAFSEKWESDGTNHWHVCSVCGLKQDEAAHEPGAEATATTDQVCTICGYVITPALGEPETTVAPTEEVPATTTQPVTPPVDDQPEGEFPWWIILVVVAAGVVIAVVATRKKK